MVVLRFVVTAVLLAVFCSFLLVAGVLFFCERRRARIVIEPKP